MAEDNSQTRKYSFFSHRECEYFPCHSNVDPEHFNCLFCYCPLYTLGDKCGGDFHYSSGGVKSCIDCGIPHTDKGYRYVISKFSEIQKLASLNHKKKKRDTE